MRNVMPLAAILVLVAALAHAAPRQLEDFDQLMDALRTGHTVRVVADYGRCQLISGDKSAESPEAVGGMTVDAWEFFAAGVVGNEQAIVVFSKASVIKHPRRGMVTNHVKFKVHADGTVLISARYLRGPELEETMIERFSSTIVGGDGGAVSFFAVE